MAIWPYLLASASLGYKAYRYTKSRVRKQKIQGRRWSLRGHKAYISKYKGHYKPSKYPGMITPVSKTKKLHKLKHTFRKYKKF